MGTMVAAHEPWASLFSVWERRKAVSEGDSAADPLQDRTPAVPGLVPALALTNKATV